VRALWLLPKAAPALLRHLAAYAELVALDIRGAQREFTTQLITVVVMGVCIFLTLLFACVGIIAYTWDTPYRVPVIACMAAGFLLLAVIAAVLRAKQVKARSPFLADVQREWQEDRVLLERILSDDELT
jgi:uncharacterized membrane protein YqjE